MITPHIMTMRNAQKPFNGADEPSHTITAGGAGLTLVAPVLTYAQQGGRNRDVEAPHHTITASLKDQNAVLTPLLVQTGYGERKRQAPSCLDLQAPLGTVVAGGAKHAAIAPFLAQHNKARNGHNPGRALDAPISTLTATGSQQGLIAPLIARHFGQSTGHGINTPSATVTAGGGGKSGLVTPWFVKYYSTATGADITDPLHTITDKPRMGHMQAELSAPPFTPDMEYRAWLLARFLQAHDVWDNRKFVTVTIKGQEYVVVDIGMRMLTPRELFNAQGFPSDYVVEGTWSQDGDEWKFHAFPKNVQVSCCGNSVCPGLARALVAANCGHLAATSQPANQASTGYPRSMEAL